MIPLLNCFVYSVFVYFIIKTKIQVYYSLYIYSCDGSLIAIASSYTFEEGEKKPPNLVEDNVYIKRLAEHEVRPKQKINSHQ